MQRKNVTPRTCFACGDDLIESTGFAHLCSECSEAAALNELLTHFGVDGPVQEGVIWDQATRLEQDAEAIDILKLFAARLSVNGWESLAWDGVPHPWKSESDPGDVERLRADSKVFKSIRPYIALFNGSFAHDLFFPHGTQPELADVFANATKLLASSLRTSEEARDPD